ncbi:MAG: GatB/YqeY domain-containing protein [Flavobacteriales bacterium]|tara:strand:- start:13469 stop:13906 length:438 start_codon:yes stop_codon:yes gene_type:complete
MLDINKEIKQAMLDKDSVKLASLRAVKSAVIMAQTEKGASEMDEAGMQKIIHKQVKQRKDAAQIYIDQSRQDLADDEIAQIKILEKFLPKQMDESEIKTIVEEVISSTGAASMADMGKVMGLVNQKLAGKADGKIIAQIVKATLA